MKTSAINLRAMRLDIEDMQTWFDLIETIRLEDEPNIPAETRLEYRKKAVENEGKICFGYVLESGEKTVGMVSFLNIGTLPSVGNPIACMVIINPKFRRRGFGEQLYASGLDQLRELGFDRCFVNVREGNDEGLAFAERLGFSEVDREYKLTLDLTTLNDDELAIPSDPEVQIFSLAQLKETDPQWAEKLHDLAIAFSKNLPSRVNISDLFPDNLDAFEKLLCSEWEINLDGSSVAMIDRVWVATTWIAQAVPDSDWCYHLMTGVRPEYRRRGLVKLLKRAGFAWGKESGIRYIHTNQHDSNKPMLSLNLGLGFKIMNSYKLLEHQF